MSCEDGKHLCQNCVTIDNLFCDSYLSNKVINIETVSHLGLGNTPLGYLQMGEKLKKI